jgi:DNA polymerase III subunit delta
MGVNVKDFIAGIGRKTPPPIILFTAGKAPWGKEDFEPYLADEAIEKMIKTHVDPGMQDLALTTFYADETDPGQVAEESRTLPFLVDRRVVLVRNANSYMAMATEKRSPVLPLLDCLETPSESTILMVVAPNADKRKRLFKLFEKNGVVVECPQLDDRNLGEWIRAEVAKCNLTIDSTAVATLIDRVGGKLSDMKNALTLLASFTIGRSSIKEADVMAACADVAESTVWALTDALAQSNTTASLEALHELFAMNKHPDEILGTINWLLESAYRTHPDTQPAAPKPFVANRVAPLAKKFSLQKLIDALALCTRTQFALRTTGANHHLLLEMLVIKLAVVNSSRQRRQHTSGN